MMKVGTIDTAHLAVKKQSTEDRQLATIAFRVMTGLDITEGNVKTMFMGLPANAYKEYRNDVNEGDLLVIKKGMMLIEPIDPVLVLEADNDKGIYKIMYTSNNYVIGCGRMDIEGKFCEAG